MTAIYPARRFLMNGSSANMKVNGSVTPVEFTYAPPVSTLFTVHEIILNATGTGNITQPLTEFWNFPALTNGIETTLSINGVVIDQPGLIKSNFDLIQFIGSEFLGKTMGTRNIMRGGFPFMPTFTLNGSNGDYFTMIINDDLTFGGHIEAMTVALRGSIVAL